MESKGNVNKHHKNSEIDSFETLHIKKTTQIGLWSHCRCYVGQYIYVIAILTVFPAVFVLSHAISTQHPETFHPASPLFFFKLSTQHQPAITRIENWAILPTHGLQFSYTLIRAFSKISAYTKTVQFYSTKNTSMNKFLAQSLSPCLMLGGIPPASLSEGCTWHIEKYATQRSEIHDVTKDYATLREKFKTISGNIIIVQSKNSFQYESLEMACPSFGWSRLSSLI